MRRTRLDPSTSLLSTGLLSALLVATAALVPVSGADADGDAGAAARAGTLAAATVLLDWQTTAIRTVYTENAQPVPVGALYLGFTSLAVLDAVRHVAAGRRDRRHGPRRWPPTTCWRPASRRRRRRRSTPTSRDHASARCPRRRAPAATRTGQLAAARMIASRTGDGGATGRTSTRARPAPGSGSPPATGIWRPGLGYVRPLVLGHVLTGPGADPLGSTAYAEDYDEVRRLGAGVGRADAGRDRDGAVSFNSNSATMLTEALVRGCSATRCRWRARRSSSARGTASMADAVIASLAAEVRGRLRRPVQAIARCRRTTATPRPNRRTGGPPCCPRRRTPTTPAGTRR